MRFACDKCQAKYQIADEKVAGKIVRMKCRKCGASLELRAEKRADGSVRPVPRPARGSQPGRADATPTGARAAGTAVHAKASAPPDAGAAGAPAPGAGGKRPVPRRVVPPRPARARRAPPAAAPPSSEPQAAESKPAAVAETPAFDRPVAASLGPPAPSDEEDEATIVKKRSLSAPALDAAIAPPSSVPDGDRDEGWFVGIDDVPVGPKPRSFLADRLAAGAIGPGSLVWRDGWVDWVPLRTVAALEDLLPAAVQPPLGSTAAPEVLDPTSGLDAIPPPAVSDPFALTKVKREQEQAEAPPAAPLPGPPADLLAGLPAQPAEPPPPESAPQPVERPESLPQPVPPPAEPPPPESAPQPAEPPEALPQPVPPPAEPPPASTPEPVLAKPPEPAAADAAAREIDEARQRRKQRDRRRRRRGMKPIAYAFIAAAGGFGAVAAYALFMPTGSPAPPAANATAVAAVGSSVASAPDADVASAPIELDPVAVLVPSGNNGDGQRGAGSGPTAAPVRPPNSNGGSAAGSSIDTSGFSNLGVDGPSAGPDSTGQSGLGPSLTEGQVYAVVNRGRPAIKRGCWNRVAGTGGGSAKVTVSFTVGPAGNVESARASGGKDFPGLASCVQAKVSGWRFPKSGGRTPVSVPFHFVTQ